MQYYEGDSMADWMIDQLLGMAMNWAHDNAWKLLALVMAVMAFTFAAIIAKHIARLAMRIAQATESHASILQTVQADVVKVVTNTGDNARAVKTLNERLDLYVHDHDLRDQGLATEILKTKAELGDRLTKVETKVESIEQSQRPGAYPLRYP